MKLAKLIEFLRDRLKTVIWVSCAVLALVVVLDAIPAVVDKEHAHTGPEHWPAFWAFFGFVGCVAIILLSKWYGHLGIMTREDYYEEELAAAGARPSPGAAMSGVSKATENSSTPGNSSLAAPEDGRTPKEGHHD